MNEIKAMDDETLIRIFPTLEKAIRNGDFKAVKVVGPDGQPCGPTIYRFPNTSIRRPNGIEINRIMELIGTLEKFKEARSYGIVGIEFTANTNSVS